MSTNLFILASALVVAAQLAVSAANRERVDMAARAEQIEAKLDRALHAWADRTFALGEDGAAERMADAAEALSARSAAPADRLRQNAP